MRTDLSAALTNALGQTITKPAWLVKISWSSPAYLSSHGTVTTFDANTWVAAPIDVRDIKTDGVKVSGSLILGNADNAYGSLVLAEGVAGKAIQIYGYDANATATADFALLVNCVGGKATVDLDKVTIDLREPTAFVHSPRTYVAPPTFTYIIPAGTTITIDKQKYRIER